MGVFVGVLGIVGKVVGVCDGGRHGFVRDGHSRVGGGFKIAPISGVLSGTGVDVPVGPEFSIGGNNARSTVGGISVSGGIAVTNTRSLCVSTPF